MGEFFEFCGNLTERDTWRRFFFVVFGAILIYFALMSDQNRVASFFGGGN